MGEYLLCKQTVVGSTPIASTRTKDGKVRPACLHWGEHVVYCC